MEGGDRFPGDNIPEVWLNVYDKLNPKDKQALSGASSVLHDWVEPKRTENLISEVTPYLIEPCEPVHSGGALQARELCQSWKEEIDQENQTHGSNTSLCFEIAADEGHASHRSRLYGNNFHVAEDVQEFMQDMMTHTGNPFPGRSIALGCHVDLRIEHEDLNEEWRDYWRSIILLLEKFGPHLHFASILFDDLDELELGTLEGQGYLRECLLRLPHLKKVSISYECGRPFVEDVIREFYRVNPLPRLEHLETVVLNRTSLATVDEVLNSCCVPTDIKRLSVRPCVQVHPKRLPFCEAVYRFVNLEVLQASILLSDLKRLTSLERRPPLRELDLSFEGAPYIEDVFMLLEPFAETLNQFRSYSRMRSRYYVVNGEPFSCNLPHLKEIFVSSVEYSGRADLLSQFKSLTHVEIWLMRDTNRQFPGAGERLDDTSIWSVMAYLLFIWLDNAVNEHARNVMEQPRQDWIDNHDTTRVQERTWSQECRSLLVEVMSSVLTDFFHGLLF